VAGVLSNSGSGHPLPTTSPCSATSDRLHRHALPIRLVVGVLGLFGLSRCGGARRTSAAVVSPPRTHRGPAADRRVSRERDDLIGQRETARAIRQHAG